MVSFWHWDSFPVALQVFAILMLVSIPHGTIRDVLPQIITSLANALSVP